MQIKRYQFNSLSFVAIVDEADCPVDPYVSCYLNGPLASKSVNTRLRYANELKFILRHFQEKNIELPARIASQTLISLKEYFQFYDRCCFSQLMYNEVENINFLDMESKQLRNVIVANQRGLAKVSSETLQGRVRCLRRFLLWLFDQFHEIRDVEEKVSKEFNRLISKIKLDEEALSKNSSGQVLNPDESVMPDEIFAMLLEMVRPSSPNNPFKAGKVRNYLIIRLLAQCGIRRGALAKLKISDFHFYGDFNKFRVYRSGCDPTDPRSDKPKQKTKSHLATISPILMKEVQLYVDLVRVKYPRSHQHDFLFVSENDSKGTAGQPISLKSINAIFQKLTKVLGFHMHPHTLRHKWNEILDVEGERLGVNPVLLEDIRKYAMGWSQGTTMNQVYNDKRLALKARELSKAHQARVDQRK
ncbi:tyrosine-type recombinase/integrase [Pseudomonas sp. NPDC047963]|jgi:integrase|nr:site-specific integrase [Pseudomonas sp.]